MTSPAPRDLHEPVPGQIDLVELLADSAVPAQATRNVPHDGSAGTRRTDPQN